MAGGSERRGWSGRHTATSERLTRPGESTAPASPSRPWRRHAFGPVSAILTSQKLPVSWPLWSILITQTALTVSWLWRSAAFTDEALYIEAGHAEWAHWLHHAAIADFPSWFSGAPALYPPLAAAADSVGGLAAARAVSLAAMLATTVLVYLIGDQLFGRLAGLSRRAALRGLRTHRSLRRVCHVRAAIPVSAGALRLGGSPDSRGRLRLAAACAVFLVAANATKYATLAWDPVILGTVLLHGWVRDKWRAIGRTASADSDRGRAGIRLPDARR